MNGSSLGFKAV